MEKYNFQIISQVEAKKIIDAEKCIILDVRTPEEFQEKHIFDAVLLPLEKVSYEAENVIPDKNAKVLVYCRSGKRSKDASYILAQKGYKNVLEFGGIIDWPFEVVQ